ncbi:MAG: DUF2326 domain-containing protein, partial [Clostridiales bacterium]|nr:DUF2326 domain-containing protein [Clostridiales bacterium]
MFLKKLTITSASGIIREVVFSVGLNLIVDETERSNESESGNSVGKTTVLKLIDFCLGADAKNVYQDSENKKNINTEMKASLEDEARRILVELVLCRDINDPYSEQIIVERNFLKGNMNICRINGEKIKIKELEDALSKKILGRSFTKPTFNQLIAHNIRYSNDRIEKCLKFLNAYSKNSDYEALHLYMFLGNRIEELYNPQEKISQSDLLNEEIKYRDRLTSNVNLSQLESKLGVCENAINELEEKRKSFTKDEDHQKASNQLSLIKTQIGFEQQTKNALIFRRELISKNLAELDSRVFEHEYSNLSFLYSEVKAMRLDGLKKTFEDLVAYHNKMIKNKIVFLKRDLPDIEVKIKEADKKIADFSNQAASLEKSLKAILSLVEFEQIVAELQSHSETKGELAARIEQIKQANAIVAELRRKLEEASVSIYCDEFKKELQASIFEFNKYFSKFSMEIYGEEYLVSVDENEDKQRKKYYEFSTFNNNFSSGKKMGEILSFDMAYASYAREKKIPSLQFILNDKKELMDINQIEKAGNIANRQSLQ